ncbi:hypothetical protein BC938DRAFT_480430 [Jimgerdemannia flammicorona]|uniref:peptidylprolyl isomerase n=1 Tax=Jimgerdemannia flammicorona TaxID=994334 RepID=A0A433QIK4_9FUNG|nr:hypothetical protein BC938DRAFT_480430 [Jimgerdemannia flammicorona]
MAPTLFTLLFLLLAIVSVSAEPPKKVKQAPPDKVLVGELLTIEDAMSPQALTGNPLALPLKCFFSHPKQARKVRQTCCQGVRVLICLFAMQSIVFINPRYNILISSPTRSHTITVNYIGKLFDDESVVFDDTLTSGPRDLKLGWEYGLRDMCVGEKRRLIIPSELANSAVIFEIELLGISSIWT